MYEKINNKKSNEDERSSSGNWSAASSTCATSSSTTTKSSNQNDDENDKFKIFQKHQPNSYSECSLSSPSKKLNQCACNRSKLNVINSDTNMNSTNENDTLKFRQNPQSIVKYANRDSKESWLQFFESTDTITNETNLDNKNRNSKKDIRLNDGQAKPHRSKRIEVDSMSNLEENEDELLSIHSLDTDGYYTSMHVSSGLFRERAQQMPLSSTFISNDDDADNCDNKLNKQNQSIKHGLDHQINKTTNDQLNNTLKAKKPTAPSPPVRSSSVISNPTTLNSNPKLISLNGQSNCEDDHRDDTSDCSEATLSGHTNSSSQQYNHKTESKSSQEEQQNNKNDYQNIPSITSPSPANTWCSSMNSDLDLVKLRNKTTIDATAYPSMVACPDSELSSLSSFGNLAFALSGNHRCTVISKSHSDNYTNCTNQFKDNSSSYSNCQTPQLSKKDSTSSLDSKVSKRSLSTIGSYASLTKLTHQLSELLKPLRNTLSGQKSSEKKIKNQDKKSKDDCLVNDAKNGKRKGFFTRFGSINRGKIVKSEHLEQLETEKQNNSEQDDMIKLRNTINKWRIEPLNKEMQVTKVLTRNVVQEKETNNPQQFLEEDENEYYAKLSQQSSNILRNSVDYSLNNDLKRFSIASNNSSKDCESYLAKKQQQLNSNNQLTSDLNFTKLSSSLNQPLNRSLNQSLNKEKRNSVDSAQFTKLFPISRYTSQDHQFLIPTPTYYENVPNTRFSYSSDNGCSNNLAYSNNSSLYSTTTMPNRPKTLNLSASLSTPFNHQQPLYGGQTAVLSNSYNCTFNPSSMNRPFLNGTTNCQQLINKNQIINGGQLINNNSLASSTSSLFNQATIPIIQNPNIPIHSTNLNLLNNYSYLNQVNQPIYHQQPINYLNQPNLNNHFQHTSSSISSHQSTPSSSYNYNYLSSTSSSLVNTPSSTTSPFHQQQQQQQQTSQLNQIKPINNQSRNLLPGSLQSNTAIVSPFCTQTTDNNIEKSTDSLKKGEERLKDFKDKKSADDSVLTIGCRNLGNDNQIQFRDSMRLTRQQREQRVQQRSSWTPSSSIVSSPSGSLGSSSNGSSTDQSAINDINKLINELSNFDVRLPQDDKKVNGNVHQTDAELNNQINNKIDPIYGVNIARTRVPIMQTNENEINGNLNLIKQSNGTDINDFKKLLSFKGKAEMKGLKKKSASEQLKITRKLNALNELEAVNEKFNENNYADNYEKETYDNVTDEECENRTKLDYLKANNSIGLMNGQNLNGYNVTNGYSNSLRTRVINGRIYKTPYRLETMYQTINEEENNEEENNEEEFIVANNQQQKTSTWV